MSPTLRVACAGTGYFSQFHYEAWGRIAGVQVEALCALDRAEAEATAARHGVAQVFDSVEAMLDVVEPDLFDIITPPPTHLELVRLAAQRGIDVVCQKPLAPSLTEAEEVANIAELAGIRLAVHENFRFMPWFREARRLLDAGVLGRPFGVAFRMRPGDGQGPRAYLDRQPYFQQMPRFLIHETGIHFIDSFRYLLGEVTSVQARLRRLNPAIAGEDAGIVLLDFANGATGLLDGNRLNEHVAENPRLTMGEMWLEGEGGVLRLDGEGRLWLKPHGQPEVEHPYERSLTGFGGDCVRRLQAHVVEHLVHGAPLETAGRDYLTNLRIEEAVYESDRSGRRIAVPGSG